MGIMHKLPFLSPWTEVIQLRTEEILLTVSGKDNEAFGPGGNYGEDDFN